VAQVVLAVLVVLALAETPLVELVEPVVLLCESQTRPFT
jgi:hypothetical protein